MASQYSRAGPSGLTKTQQLRQARSAALMKEYQQKEESAKRPVESVRRRKYVPPEAKKVEFTKPAMTKTMLARVKHAEKFKQEYERKREEEMPMRRIRRTPAPVLGDPRLGRERLPMRRAPTPSPPVSPARAKRVTPSPARRRAPLPAIPQKTKELARSMKAQVIQAEPVGEGPIDSIVIPPRAVHEDRTTIVSIPQPAEVPQVTNRSIQVISETLDEQDAVEVATMQNKLEDLQQARRDFVMTAANVGGNVMQLTEEEQPRYIYKVPDIEGDVFRVKYGRDHPVILAAREFVERSMAGIREREAARRMEEEFKRQAREPILEDLRLDVPFKEEFPRDVSWEDEEPYEYPTFDPEELERFFDIERYPPSPPRGPPPGREHLHPDLWELEDPWATCGRCLKEDVSDLIRFESP